MGQNVLAGRLQAKKKTRRRYGAELKQQILAECAEPGASVASISLSHGIYANVVHKWRREAGGGLPALQAPAFVPVPLPPAACAPAPVPDTCSPIDVSTA